MVLNPLRPDANVLEGVELLEALMHRVVYGKNSAAAA